MKKVKKILSIAVIFAILFSSLSITTFASGSSDFTVENGVLTKYTGSGGNVDIPGDLGITSIGYHAFYQSKITSVTIPSGVISIGKFAFESCGSLTSVWIPDGVTFIGEAAFLQCNRLTSISLPDSVATVDEGAFIATSISSPIFINNRKTLCYVPSDYKTYTIPDTVTVINGAAFVNCNSLTSVTIPDSVTKIDIDAFWNCASLTTVTIPASVTSIGQEAFKGCSNLTSAKILNSAAAIGTGAFLNCDKLIIYGAVGSSVQQYAEDNNFQFIVIDVPSQASKIAVPTHSTVLVNSSTVAFEAYNIDGNNYFKLRDLAKALNGTGKQFEVGWDAVNNAINLTASKAYTSIGGELIASGNIANKSATLTTSRVYLNGSKISITAYNIGGNNYFKLRDIGEAIDFGVEWDGNINTIKIDTSTGYSL